MSPAAGDDAVPSLSSMWSVRRFEEYAAFETAAIEAGFGRVELNYEASPEFLAAARRGRLAVTSLHAPLPAGPLVTRRPHWEPSLSALDDEERRIALGLAVGTIDLASDFGARAVVVHLGGVPEARDAEYELRDLVIAGTTAETGDTTAFAEAREALALLRDRHQPASFEAARRTLASLVEHAARRGVSVGLETRHHVFEIPNVDEMGLLLDEYAGGPAGYWHDAGHVEQGRRLGFTSHETWLERHAGRMIGAHLHDIVGIRDHYAAGLGDMPWALLATTLPAGVIRTCEFGGFNSPAEVRDGLALLEREGVVAMPAGRASVAPVPARSTT